MKRIALSLLAIALVAGGVGGTLAFYSDTETSTNNIFVAGAIDLTVDHTRQTYNGVDCQTCSVTVYSSPSTVDVIDSSVGASYTGPFPIDAVDITNPHPNWVDENDHAPAQWVWVTDPVDTADKSNNAEYTFRTTFDWQGPVVGVDLDLGLASDNGYAVYLNDVLIVDKLAINNNFSSISSLTAGEETAFANAVVLGENRLDIIVLNREGNTGPDQNPAGLLFFLEITSDCELPEFQAYCTLFTERDLGDGDTFFNFGDIKPGDEGVNVISLHVYDNDAYTCLFPHDLLDEENNIVEPEAGAGDVTANEGELSNFIRVFAWEDTDADGVYENGENVLVTENTPLNEVQTEIVAMSLAAETTGYVGFAWCVGEQSLNGFSIECSGGASGIDTAQTDSVAASLTAYAVQQRNNDQFSCEAAFEDLFPAPIIN